MIHAERLLLGPGPSNPFPEVMEAFQRPVLGHLDADFLVVLDEIGDRLRTVFRTANTLTLPMSGTGSAGMETCFVNLVEPGDTAIIGVNGVFGERMCEVARRCGAEVVRVEAEWGHAIDPQRLLDAHRAAPGRACARGRARRDVDRRRERRRAAVGDQRYRHAARRRHGHFARWHPGRRRRVGDRRRVLRYAEMSRCAARTFTGDVLRRERSSGSGAARIPRSLGISISASSPTTSGARGATTTPRRSRCSTRCTPDSACCSTKGSKHRGRATH